MPEAPVAAIVLAAGSASRFRGDDADARTKAVALVDGAPMVRRAVDAALGAGAHPVIVVTGYGADDVAHALAGRDVTMAHNETFASGLASSLRTGVAALPRETPAALVLLADMPRIGAPLVSALIEAWRAHPHASAIVPSHEGAWGNPVLITARLFPDLAKLEGDAGARRVLQGRDDVIVLPVEDAGVALDIDTPDALKALRRND